MIIFYSHQHDNNIHCGRFWWHWQYNDLEMVMQLFPGDSIEEERKDFLIWFVEYIVMILFMYSKANVKSYKSSLVPIEEKNKFNEGH